MHKVSCTNCVFGDKCPSSVICDDYASLYQPDIETIIEANKISFLRDWDRYSTQYGDEDEL